MSAIKIASGVWWNYSESPTAALTLTLPIGTGNVLLSGLTLLVTVAAASLWSITAFFLHAYMTKPGPSSVVDLQHRVGLRNTHGPLGTLWEVSKIYWAWAKKRQPGLFFRTCLLAVPACLVWAAGVAAGLLVSQSVAYNPSYRPVVARVQPSNCGLWTYSQSPEDGGAIRVYQQAETHKARAYVNNFYANTSSSFAARSVFPQTTLPYNVSTSAPCPVAPAERCWLGPNGAFSMSTDLDSNSMLGANAKEKDRISLRWNVTCSPVHVDDYVEQNTRNNRTFLDFFLGPILDGTINSTWSYYLDMPATNADYLLWPIFSLANSSLEAKGLWDPIPDFNRTDADVSIFFLGQNAVSYMTPVLDPWFSASGPNNHTLPGKEPYFRSDQSVGVMACAEQYSFCNPTTSTCSPGRGVADLINRFGSMLGDRPTLAQAITAARLVVPMTDATLYQSVVGLGAAALFANDLLGGHISPGLPEDQWRAELLGWFQTSLAKIQAFMVQYASKPEVGSFMIVDPPFDRSAAITAALQEQCANQLVQTAGEVQNFGVVAVLVIVCLSVALIGTDLLLEKIVDFLLKRRVGKESVTRRSRQVDHRLHLLRMAIEGPVGGVDVWEPGSWGVPVLRKEQEAGATQVRPPALVGQLATYHVAMNGGMEV